MATILKTKSIYFNDVNLLPRISQVESRSEVDTELHRVFVAPMLSLVGVTFAKRAAQLGLSLTTPRFMCNELKIEIYKLFEDNKISEKQKCFIAIGPNEKDESLVYLKNNTNCSNWLVDQANGYLKQLPEKVKRLSEYLSINRLMIGNVVCGEGVKHLYDVGFNNSNCNELYVRNGVGNGKICKSSDVASINRGQLTELIECKGIIDNYNQEFLDRKENKFICCGSDGGISKSGFALKAFGGGAEFVLMGSYFSLAKEAETNITEQFVHFGCASERQNKLAGLDKTSEGKEFLIDKTKLKPLEELVKDLKGGIASGISYCGYKNVSDFIGNGVFEIKQNSLPPKSRV